MTVSIEYEDALVAQIEAEPDRHICLPADEYRADGRILVSRDGLRISLHRQLWKRLRPSIPSSAHTSRSCAEEGCQNPFHYSRVRRRAKCRNGHEYTPADRQPDGSYRCLICLADRYARRRRGGLSAPELMRQRMVCPNGHRYTEANTYRYNQTRKCKACTIARASGRDPALEPERT